MSKRVPLGRSITKKEEQPKLPASERAKNFLTPIEEKLISELDDQKFTISNKTKPYLMQVEKQDADLMKLRKIAERKQKMQNRLDELSTYEKKYEEDINLKKIFRDRNYSTLRAKSQLSKEDAAKLKKLKQQQRNFERELQEKTRKFEQKQLAEKLERKELEQRKMQEINEKKKQQIGKRLEQMAEKRNFRHMRFEEEKKQLTRLKVQKKMFQQLNDKFEKAEEMQKMKRVQQYEKRIKQRVVDLNSLRQHEQKYQEVLKEKKEELASKRIEASRLHRSSLHSQHKSKFYTIVIEEQQKARKQERQKRNQNKEVAERMRDYSYVVKRDHAPRIKTKEDEDEEQKSAKQSRIAVDPEELRKMGLNNLELCKSLGAKNKKNRKLRLEDLDRSPPKSRYTDYLSETRKSREQKSEGHSTRFCKSFKHDVEEVRKIMNEKKTREVEKVEQIRRVAQKIDSSPQNLGSDGILNKIAAKLSLLEALQ